MPDVLRALAASAAAPPPPQIVEDDYEKQLKRRKLLAEAEEAELKRDYWRRQMSGGATSATSANAFNLI